MNGWGDEWGGEVGGGAKVRQDKNTVIKSTLLYSTSIKPNGESNRATPHWVGSLGRVFLEGGGGGRKPNQLSPVRSWLPLLSQSVFLFVFCNAFDTIDSKMLRADSALFDRGFWYGVLDIFENNYIPRKFRIVKYADFNMITFHGNFVRCSMLISRRPHSTEIPYGVLYIFQDDYIPSKIRLV